MWHDIATAAAVLAAAAVLLGVCALMPRDDGQVFDDEESV